MKAKILILGALLMLTFACDKKHDTIEGIENYFTINGSEFINAKLPDATTGVNTPSITFITGNSKVINGGSNPIVIYSNSAYSHILVAVKDIDNGYYKIPASLKSAGATGGVFLNLLMGTQLPKDKFVIRVALMNSNNEIGSYKEITVNTIEVAEGSLQISCSWDLLNDVDLHVIEPDGNEIYFGNEGFDYDWAAIIKQILKINVPAGTDPLDINLTNEQEDRLDNLTYKDLQPFILDTIPGGNLDLDSNADCTVDSVNNENINYPKISEVQSGEYIVKIDYYSDCQYKGATHYIVTARYNGELLKATSSINPYIGEFKTGTDDGGGEGDGVEVMRFKISNNSYKSAEVRKYNSFSFPADNSIIEKQKARVRTAKTKRSKLKN